ncbi:MAG TPA: hypothetical protein VIM34_08070 [Burkholderiaceae bacterium]
MAQDSPLPEALPPAAHVTRISGDLPGLLSIEADAPQRRSARIVFFPGSGRDAQESRPGGEPL